MVLTSHSKLGDTGEKTGFWVEEFAAPYYTLADAGAVRVNFPSASVKAPLLPLLITMLTPDNGFKLASIILPVIVFSCAINQPGNIKKHSNPAIK